MTLINADRSAFYQRHLRLKFRFRKVFQNVTKTSLAKGTAILTVLAAAVLLYLTRWGMFGFVLTGIPLWCFGVLASAGGIVFFLGPMLFGSDPSQPLSAEKGKELFLYLRPFEIDARSFLQLMVGASMGVLVYFGLFKGLWWPLTFVPLIININKEQNFQDVFTSLGQFIAFGKPHEWLQPIGASRVYYAEDKWKSQVLHYMSLARIVIIRPGESKSIRWEIEQLKDLVPPERIVFYLKFRGLKKRRERAYQSFRDHLQSKLPTKLPEQLDKARFLIFDHSWHAHFVEEANQPSQLLSQIASRSGDVSKDNLRPLLKALNLDLPAQPNNLLDNLMTVGLWVIAFLSVGLVFVALFIATIQILAALTLLF